MTDVIHLETHRAKRGLAPAKRRAARAPEAPVAAPTAQKTLRQRVTPCLVAGVLVALVGVPSGSPALTVLVAGFGFWLTRTAATSSVPVAPPTARPAKPRRSA